MPETAAPSAWGNPGFRIYFVTYMLAMMADNVEHVISYWMAFQKFQSPALGGFAVVSHWPPYLLFSVAVGGLADRVDPRRLIQLGMALFMAVSLAWGLLFLTDSLQLWQAMVLLVVHGLAGVFWQNAGQLLLHDIAAQGELPSAIRLSATARYLGLLVGPAVGGGLMMLLGPIWGIFLNAALYLPLLWWMWKAPYGPKFRVGGTPPLPRPVNGLADIVQTAREVAQQPLILPMVLLAGTAAFFVGNSYHAQMPGFATDLGHGHADVTYSALLAADVAGALLAPALCWSAMRGCNRTRAARCCWLAPGRSCWPSLPPRHAMQSRWCCCSPLAFSNWPSAAWRRRWCNSTPRPPAVGG